MKNLHEKNQLQKLINNKEYNNSTKERDNMTEFIKSYQLKNKNRASTTNSSLK